MTNKEMAVDFIRNCADGHADKAFQTYAGKNFKHHNAFFKGDANTLMNAMLESDKQIPNRSFEIKRVIAEGDTVAIHSHMKPSPEHLGYATMHILRFDNGKIAEMWDFAQEIPKDMANENGMF
jgi:predicted SnoaL-like aldol condensation-catalyzing enzyme